MKKIKDSLALFLLVGKDDDEGFDKLVMALEDLTDYFYFSTAGTKRLRIAAKLIKQLERQRTNFWFFQPSFPQALRDAAKKLRKQLGTSKGLYPLCYTEREQAQEDEQRFLSDIDKIIVKHYPK